MGRVAWAKEVLAGLAGAIGSVPDGMAMAVLAGTNPMAGLYASVAGPAAGGLAQSTTVMVVATTSAAAVTASQVATDGGADPARTLSTLAVLTAVAIVVATLLGVARLLRFVSRSVMGGLMFGVGLILVLGQLADAMGVAASGTSVVQKTWDTVANLDELHLASLATAVAAVAINVVLARTRAGALAPVAAIALPAVVIGLTDLDVATVGSSTGEIEVGLPPLVLPDWQLISPTLVSTAVALVVVVLVQAAGVATAYPNQAGPPNDVRRDFFAQGAGNAASGLLGGIPVGASVAQTALNVLSGGRTRWAAVLSGAWMLAFVVALGPLLSEVPVPALAGLLILAGASALRPRELLLSWRAGRSSGLAAAVTLLATLVLPVHQAVLVGVLLSLLLVGIDSATAVRVVVLERTGPGRWRRSGATPTVTPGAVAVLDVQGPTTFAAAPRTFDRLPHPGAVGPAARPFVVVVRLRGYLRANLTFTAGIERYGRAIGGAGGRLVVCGLQRSTIERLRALGLPTDVVLIAEGDELGGSLDEAWADAVRWIDASGPTPGADADAGAERASGPDGDS